MSFWQSVRAFFARATTADEPSSRLWFASRTQAGVFIDGDSMFRNAVVWACVQYLTRAIGQLPWRVLKELPNGGAERATTHPVDWLLHKRPNPEMGAMTFKQTLLASALTRGNGYAEIQRDARNMPVALWPIATDRVQPKRREGNGELYYRIHNGLGRVVDLDAMNVFHLRGFPGPDGVIGLDVVAYAAQSIGWAQATELFGASFFGEGMNPAGVIETPKGMDQPGRDRLKAELENLYKGPRKANRTALLDAGMKWTRISVQPNEAQFIESMQHQVEQICVVPGTKVLTIEGPRSIETLKEGQLVLTHRGRWRRVRRTMSRDYAGEVVTVQAKGLAPVTTTANHPFLVQSCKPSRTHQVESVGEPEWISAKDLEAAPPRGSRRAFQALVMPRLGEGAANSDAIDLLDWCDGLVDAHGLIRASRNGRSTPVRRCIPKNYLLGWLIGAFVGDGSTTEKEIVYYIGVHEPALTEMVCSRLEDVFGVAACVYSAGPVNRIVVCNRVLAGFFREFGHLAQLKHFEPWCLEANEEFRQGLLDGLMVTDGCLYKGMAQIRTASEDLAWQCRLLLWSQGTNSGLIHTAAGKWVIHGRTGDCRENWTVHWRFIPERRGTAGVAGDHVYFKLDAVERSIYTGSVFNLEVEEDESYTTVGGVVHNCRWFGVPPHKVQHLLRATFSNIEHQSIEVVVDAIAPWAKLFEEEADYKLFGAINRQGFYTKLYLQGLMRGDAKSRGEFYKLMRESGAISADEIRALEDLNPLPEGEGGTKYIVQSQYTTLARIGEDSPAAVAPAQTSDDAASDGAAQPPADYKRKIANGARSPN